MALVNKHCNRTYEMLVLGALATDLVDRRSQKQHRAIWSAVNWLMSGLDKQILSMHVPVVGSGEAKDLPDRSRMWAKFPPIRGIALACSECSEGDLPFLGRPNAPRCFHWTRTQHPPAIF